MNMSTISAATTSPLTPATILSHKPSPRLASPVVIGLKRGKVMCSLEKKEAGVAENGSTSIGLSGSLLAAVCAATVSSPAMALVDDRMSTEGTGLPFGLSNNLLGWILFGVFGLIWALYFVYTATLEEDEESGLSL
ncbi:Photosystem II reaction center W protein [Hibiscus syriacus]|uniref:PSII 6.1 kDa protein n=1 Tax=Hibiscus syriacus TaxID=106335 RepID=A0A6A2ZY82_HIBSY|nr:photosystem II reaction center W protein, chloroplastic-like [Hibiscus syriacus]KAE8696940.1 Photosystem II reaction center W protein [Hibiscus syriacus]